MTAPNLLVVTLGPAPAGAEAALAAAAGMPVTVLALAHADAAPGARIIHGLDAALRSQATIAAIVPALDAAAIAALAGPVARGDADIAFAVPDRAGWIDRRATRWLGTAPGALQWQAMAASRAALARLPYKRNDDGALFPCELALQAARAGLRAATVPAGALALERASGCAMLRTVLRARVQRLHILYDRRFDCAPDAPAYEQKLGYKTPHTVTARLVPAGARVLDLGAADGYVARLLAAQGCTVTAVDRTAPTLDPGVPFIVHDLDRGPPPLDLSAFDVVLMLDVIEHLREPERFVEALGAVRGRLIVSTGNVAFIVTRLMLLVGQFNYGRRGILDLTHTRLFTRRTLERLLHEAGFRVSARHAIPAPFAAALGTGRIARTLTALNGALAWLLPGLFAYQILVVAEPRPSLDARARGQTPGAPSRTEGTR